MKLLPVSLRPAWFEYPSELLSVIDAGSLDIGPWQILTGQWLEVRLWGLRKRFPDRDLVPFARRLDCDDVACFERASFPEVQNIHDFATPGWEQNEAYPSFGEWLSAAKRDAADYDGD